MVFQIGVFLCVSQSSLKLTQGQVIYDVIFYINSYMEVDSSPSICSWPVRSIEMNSGQHGDMSFFQALPNY